MSDSKDRLSCAEFKELSSAYALAALDEHEQQACARHLAWVGPHVGCDEALVDARVVAAQLVAALPVRPPPAHLWGAIEARLRSLPADPAAATAWVREMTAWALLVTATAAAATASAQISLLR